MARISYFQKAEKFQMLASPSSLKVSNLNSVEVLILILVRKTF